MNTITEDNIEKFPFNEGDPVIIKWSKDNLENAIIAKLKTSIQSNVEVVHAVMCISKSSLTPFVVSANLLKRP